MCTPRCVHYHLFLGGCEHIIRLRYGTIWNVHTLSAQNGQRLLDDENHGCVVHTYTTCTYLYII